MRDWNYLSQQKWTDLWNCNYFKALWGIETSVASEEPVNMGGLQLFQSLMRDWNNRTWTYWPVPPIELQLFQSLMRDWNNDGRIPTGFREKKLQLFQSLMRDWNSSQGDNLSQIVSWLQLFQSLMRDWNATRTRITIFSSNCNYFKALWGIETILFEEKDRFLRLQLFQSLMRDWNQSKAHKSL